MKNNNQTIIFAGGGTGGHLYPAIAIAEELKIMSPNFEIIFIGSKNKIESKVVPQYKYKFETIFISGFSRKLNFSNFIFPIKILVALIQSFIKIIKYNPKVVIGTGGYVSGPVLWCANILNKPTILQDHNSYPGKTTKLLSKKANEIHLAFEDSKKYFTRKDNLFVSGFPIRKEFEKIDKKDALDFFQLNNTKKIIFVTGGSQGAKSINNAMLEIIENLYRSNVQVIWQTGKYDYQRISERCRNMSETVKVFEFLKEMNYAYSACDLAIARSGASTIGEIIKMAVPSILIPFPFAAEDHQSINAMALVNGHAAFLIKDNEVSERLLNTILHIFQHDNLLDQIKTKLKNSSNPNTARDIAKRITDLANKYS